MMGYSDPINHALAFAAKYYVPRSRKGTALSYLTHPSHNGLILARYGCDEHTIIAGILHPVIAETRPDNQHLLRHKVADKFGSVVITILSDSCEPRHDSRGHLRPWNVYKLEYLEQLSRASNRALEVTAASEIHQCGSLLADVRRLGTEYLTSISLANAEQLLWWYRSLIETMDSRPDWKGRMMVSEMRLLAADLARQLLDGER
ncbi:MAG: HD domain-containing protein [Gemmatimonadota bacterium]